MNVLEVIDEKGEVTNIGLEAQIALEEGDTDLSARLFRQGGRMIEANVAGLGKASERDLARFLAATQYFKAGAYQEAAKVCDRIQHKRLPSHVRHLYPPFLTHVRERSDPDYVAEYDWLLKENFRRAMNEGDTTSAQKVIDILKDHHYIIPKTFMALVRARCCEILGKRRAASLFYRSAWRFDPDNAFYPFAYLNSLCKEGRHEEAWAIVVEHLGNDPGARWPIHAMSVINAALYRDRNEDAAFDERPWRQRRSDLLRQFDSALESLTTMGREERKAIDPLINHAFLLAWVSYLEMDDLGKQLEALDLWMKIRPGSHRPRALRGLMTYPSPASERDFREAIRLGSTDPLPYYFLAHDALLAGQFRDCDQHCTRALQLDPEPGIRGNLLFWQALSRWNLGRDRAEIRHLFDEAMTLRPDDPRIADIARSFAEGGGSATPPTALPPEDDRAWGEQARRDFYEDIKKWPEKERPLPDDIAA